MKVIFYIGGYTDAKREGIHIFEMDTDTGAFKLLGQVPGIENSTYLALNKSRTRLYCGMGDPRRGDGSKNGGVAAFAVDGAKLTLLNSKPIGVTPPCYVSLDPQEKRLVFAEYSNAVAGVFALAPDGSLADTPPVTVHHTGSGPDKSRQEKAHAHCAVVSPDSKYLCIVDLGIDRVKVYDYPSCMGGLKELPAVTFASAPGAGPRHILFHPNGKLAFVLHELDNTVTSYQYTGKAFIPVQTVSLLPPDFKAYSKASALKLSADGRQLFGTNRGHDSIAAFDLDTATGRMSLKAISKLAGESPRDFSFAPGGKFALVGHENSNSIMVYAYNAATGVFTPMSYAFDVYRPVCVLFGDVSKNK